MDKTFLANSAHVSDELEASAGVFRLGNVKRRARGLANEISSPSRQSHNLPSARGMISLLCRAHSAQQPRCEFLVAADVGEALVSALERICQLAVVQAEELQDRGVQLADVDAVVDGAEAALV